MVTRRSTTNLLALANNTHYEERITVEREGRCWGTGSSSPLRAAAERWVVWEKHKRQLNIIGREFNKLDI